MASLWSVVRKKAAVKGDPHVTAIDVMKITCNLDEPTAAHRLLAFARPGPFLQPETFRARRAIFFTRPTGCTDRSLFYNTRFLGHDLVDARAVFPGVTRGRNAGPLRHVAAA